MRCHYFQLIDNVPPAKLGEAVVKHIIDIDNAVCAHPISAWSPEFAANLIVITKIGERTRSNITHRMYPYIERRDQKRRQKY
jgi:hypothetical protein